jgi:hypothetical protein
MDLHVFWFPRNQLKKQKHFSPSLVYFSVLQDTHFLFYHLISWLCLNFIKPKRCCNGLSDLPLEPSLYHSSFHWWAVGYLEWELCMQWGRQVLSNLDLWETFNLLLQRSWLDEECLVLHIVNRFKHFLGEL